MNVAMLYVRGSVRACAAGLCLALSVAIVGCGTSIARDERAGYVAFGDSTTAGPDSPDYPEILAELLQVEPEEVANQGMSGETTADGLQRLTMLFDADIFPNAHTWIYWEGGNDLTDFISRYDPLLVLDPEDQNYPWSAQWSSTLDATAAAIVESLERIQAEGRTVYVVTLYDVSADTASCPPLPFDVILDAQATRANKYIAMLNDRIREAAVDTGARLIDVEALDAELREGQLYFDCNHLDAMGHARVAELFYEAITNESPP